MSSTVTRVDPHVDPPDQPARLRALDATRSVLVQAPAGSGKTDLLTRRFLRLLGEVDDPGQIVAITFTKAAAAEMRHRILGELEKSAAAQVAASEAGSSEFAMETLAARALARSQARGWNLADLSSQLRVTTIDAFCRELALRQPLLSGLGGDLDIASQPQELYRRAARRTLEQIDTAEPELRSAIEMLLLWRDNGWQEMEDLLIKMLSQRDRWMHWFLLDPNPDWALLRELLERPFARAVHNKLLQLTRLLEQVPHAREEAQELARFACGQSGRGLYRELAELAEFPEGPFESTEQLEEVREACACLADFLQTQKGEWRTEKGLNAKFGFPATDAGRAAKKRFGELVSDLEKIEGLRQELASIGELPPARYTEEDWGIVRACFALLRRAAAELKVVFAEQGKVDYAEVAQIALSVLKGDESGPGDTALAIADDIRHLLVDEFQDTSRRQHQLLVSLIAAWPQQERRTCFVVGDPMQSIYFFRDADAELFPRVREVGLEVPGEEPHTFHPVRLTANFRTAPALVQELNHALERVFEGDDGSGVTFTAAEAARSEPAQTGPRLVEEREEATRMQVHLRFVPQNSSGVEVGEKQQSAAERDLAQTAQVEEIINLIRSHWPRIEAARVAGEKYRIAVLGRARKALTPVAAGLREADIPFAAVDLEALAERQEVLDALALTRALLNPYDRVAWLGVLRAPWCGLSLADLHTLVSADDAELQMRPVPALLAERAELICEDGQQAVRRVLNTAEAAVALRAAQPGAVLGTWIEQVWLQLGGAACVDAAGRANLDLLWNCLDNLPEGEQGVLGPALNAALFDLTALPDPESDINCGVQLMTIHKAKGLEFEVVIVPELQAGSGRSQSEMLAWLERGLAEPDESGEVTEFLVAPIQSKGTERSNAKAWVDRIRRDRETQELRRLLYVAMTRAREELHLFARPAYKSNDNGDLELSAPQNCLLKTAWPAFQREVQQQFEQWRETSVAGIVESLAATEQRASAVEATTLWRLPADYQRANQGTQAQIASQLVFGDAAEELYHRHEGGLLSRTLGIAVHSLMQELAQLRQTREWDAARTALTALVGRITAQVRASGIDRAQAEQIAAQALEIALQASQEATAQWILSPHSQAENEARWAGIVGEGVHTVQVDRVFRAGGQPQSEGDAAWWIIDYKTAQLDGGDVDKALPKLREQFAPQLEAYARVLRGLHGQEATVRTGIYYPRMLRFDWWEI